MEVALLDHGYVKLIPGGIWGSDELIIESARMSTAGGFKGWGWHHQEGCLCEQDGHVLCSCRPTPGDEKLLRYLWEHDHSSPFEMAGLTVEIQAPMFVARQIFRHRTFSYNELSARYTEMPNLYYTPSLERIKNGRRSSKNKQGSEGGFGDFEARYIQGAIELANKSSRAQYEELTRLGLANELTRLVVPMSQYTRWRMSGNLWNWTQFLRKRLPDNVQLETREYAVEILKMAAGHCPRTIGLFKEEMDGIDEKVQ